MHWIALQPGREPAADDLLALGWWALRFTPRVALPQQAQAVLLEVSASERLFGGWRQLVSRLLGPERPLERIELARAPTALLALARLQAGPAAGRDPDQLPLHTLAEAQPHLATLERIGCRTWGDLRALPRGGVVRRFGAALLDALDRAYGLRPEVYPWLMPPEVFDLSLELQAQVESAPALLFAARRLLERFRCWLQARQQGVLAFELGWQMDARRDAVASGALCIRTAVPTLDMAHLQRLLSEHLERTTLPAPVLYLRLRSIETAALPAASASLLPDAQRMGDDLTHLLERLAARLGPDQVLQAVACADHRPEQMQAWVPAAAAGGSGHGGPRAAGKGADPRGIGTRHAPPAAGRRRAALAQPALDAADALYPTWLLAAPLRLAVHQDRPLYQGPLTLLAGPQRLEAAWWDVAGEGASRPPATRPGAAAASSGARATRSTPDGPNPAGSGALQPGGLALRDYFLARSAHAGLLWIYRERLTVAGPDGGRSAGQWYLHGVFG